MLLQSLLALAVVLALFAVMVWGMKRFQGHTGSASRHDFKIIQRIHIDNKNSIVEIRHRGVHYLLGLSPGGMTQLRADAGAPQIDEAATDSGDGKVS